MQFNQYDLEHIDKIAKEGQNGSALQAQGALTKIRELIKDMVDQEE